VVDEPFFEDFGTALPVDVAAAAGKEGSDGVAPEVVDPAFLRELAHERVDPGEAGAAVLPTLEVGLCFGVINQVFPGDKLGFRIDSGGQVPGDKSALSIVVCLLLAGQSLRERERE
jgi:hypothetical protein